MKRILNNIGFLVALIVSFFLPGKAKAASKNLINDRVNKIRTVINQESQKGTTLKLTGNDIANKRLIDWGNWGNWNNWNNWRDWNNWANWANWGNWGNY
jgi:hypothetical protein